jgi:hypothetical protein
MVMRWPTTSFVLPAAALNVVAASNAAAMMVRFIVKLCSLEG